MKPIPLLDHVGSPIFVFLFALLLFLQWKYPLRRQHFSSPSDWTRETPAAAGRQCATQIQFPKFLIRSI